MYRKQEQPAIPPENFELTNECKLSQDNRWVMMASLIPWSEFEEEYASKFNEEMGAPAKSFRMALGALIIKEKLGISDNESGDFKTQVEDFKDYTGFYPESVHVDKIYRTRENRDWCRERGIRISGAPLGRPPANVSKEKKKQAKDDERIRNCIEGKFGQGKRRFSLGRVMAKLSHTSQTAIAVTFLVMNLSTHLSRLFYAFLCRFFKTAPFLQSLISEHSVLIDAV
ncbi:transposase [Scytonema hofmannii FACHB-248]|uniref:Transposase n=1 Tax=Scytonema hofmannii FACHB-248 TaxID=1842502 RepID=A0ABR8H2K9_9CYAN|nr:MULTISPECIES: transposase [Nostocales]MBD2609486.1 transposase [Scytonema hofmannii FACHB-248]